jgi:manganese/zinc/iron transport system substrate-binding protein
MKKIIYGIIVHALICLTVAVPFAFAAPLKVVATIGQITDMVKEIGGDRVDTQGLMGPGVDPHLYRASESDVLRLSQADIIFYNGLHLEAKMGEVFERMSRTKTIVAVTADVPHEELLADPIYPDAHDPHVWFDVTIWKRAAEKIRDALIARDPVGRESYEANAQRYLAEVEEIHQYIIKKTSELPAPQRILVTAHDAFRYFGKRYGFEVVGLQGISTETEAGTRDVMKIADFIVERKIKAVFIESSVPERNIKAVQQAVRARGWEVKIGGELFSDAMGNQGTREGTYIGMVEHNINTIVDALK